MEDKTYKGNDFKVNPLPLGTYDNCQFLNCNFMETDLSQLKFIDCTFENCDLTNSNLTETTFREVTFKGRKLMGLHFESSHKIMFIASFENCNLQYSSFYQMKLNEQHFKSCNLANVDFTETKLSRAIFEKCNLNDTKFEQTNLGKADFSSSSNFEIDPEINHIVGAVFSKNGLPGLLRKYKIKITN